MHGAGNSGGSTSSSAPGLTDVDDLAVTCRFSEAGGDSANQTSGVSGIGDCRREASRSSARPGGSNNGSTVSAPDSQAYRVAYGHPWRVLEGVESG